LFACDPEGNSALDGIADDTGGKADALTEAAVASAALKDAKMDNKRSDPCDDVGNPAFDPDTCGDPDASVGPYNGKWRVSGVEVAASGA
jgi:hypothetical protein